MAVAIGAVVGAVVGTTVAAVDGVAILEPQALTMTPRTSVVTASHGGRLCDM
jgi:hypothetical protein